MDNRYRKLGGWLLAFLVFRVIAIAVAVNLLRESLEVRTQIEMAGRYYGAGYMASYYSTILDGIILIAGNIGIIVLMFKKNESALGWIKKIFVSITGLDIVIAIGARLYLSTLVSESLFSSSDVSGIGGAVIGLVLWYQYFVKSRRVAIYFDENYEETIDVILD